MNTEVKIAEFELTQNQLNELQDDHFAILSILSFACTEINILRKIFVTQSHPSSPARPLNELIEAHRHLILRTWSSKLYELEKFLFKIAGDKSQVIDNEAKEWTRETRSSYTKLEKASGRNTVKILRDNISNHYDFQQVKLNKSHIFANRDHSLYTHENGGNDFFPLGENAVFQARLKRAFREDERIGQSMFEDWLDWILSATDFWVQVNASACKRFLFDRYPEQSFVEKSYVVSDELIAAGAPQLMPILLVRSETQ